METIADRRAPRWGTRIPVRYHVFDGRTGRLQMTNLEAARAYDIGENGLFLSRVDAPIGTRIHFFFELPESWGGLVEAYGEVVHDRPRLDTTGFETQGVGVRMLRMSPRDRGRLDRYLAERRLIDAAYLSAAEVRRRAERMRGLHTN
jgi:hypothetical protein